MTRTFTRPSRPDCLPSDFPTRIETIIRKGEHRGCPTFWAPYARDGKLYRLVVNPPRGGQELEDEDTWAVLPTNSPNGHLIFCKAHTLLHSEQDEERLDWTLLRRVFGLGDD